MLDSRPFKPLGGLEVEFAGQRVVACEELRIGLSVAVRGVLAELIDVLGQLLPGVLLRQPGVCRQLAEGGVEIEPSATSPGQ